LLRTYCSWFGHLVQISTSAQAGFPGLISIWGPLKCACYNIDKGVGLLDLQRLPVPDPTNFLVKSCRSCWCSCEWRELCTCAQTGFLTIGEWDSVQWGSYWREGARNSWDSPANWWSEWDFQRFGCSCAWTRLYDRFVCLFLSPILHPSWWKETWICWQRCQNGFQFFRMFSFLAGNLF